MARGGFLSVLPDGRVRLPDPAAQAVLSEALSQAGRPGRGRSRSLRLAGPDGPEAVHIVPLDERSAALAALGWFGDTSLPAALIAVEPLRRDPTLGRVLSDRLGLTATEAQVVAALAEGTAPAVIAETRRASVHTIRNQIKSAMSKAGVRRQIELVQIVERMKARQ